MLTKLKEIKLVPWFYFLFSIFPLLYLWKVNANEIDPSVVLRPFIFTLCGTAILYGVLYYIFRHVNKAAYIGILILLLFYSYGHVYDFLRHSPSMSDFGRHRVLIPAYIVLLGLGIWGIISHAKKLKEFSGWLNITCILLVFGTILQLGFSYITTASVARKAAAFHTNLTLSKNLQDQPDVYFIVLDTYMSTDALQKEMGYDNSAFVQQLTELGFYVARCSRSNYDFTKGSIASVLNMEYLPALETSIGISTSDEGFWSVIRNNEVHRQL